MAKVSEYRNKLDNIVNSTHVGLCLCLSKDVGILQVLLDARKPLTSLQIAAEKDLKERYARELLDCLATAEIIHASTDESGVLVYQIPEDGKKEFKSHPMAFISYAISMIKIYDSIKSCLHNTGPYGYRMTPEAYDSVEELGVCQFDDYVGTILKCVDGLKAKLESGIDVLEVGCGKGRLLTTLAQMFPRSTFTASDNVKSLLDDLKASLGRVPNIKCDFLDLCCPTFPSSKRYDWVNCAHVIHHVPNPPQALKNIRKLLKPGGTFTMIDMAPSGSPIGDRGNLFVGCLYAVSMFICIPDSYQTEDSHAMGSCWGKQQIMELLRNAGFEVKVGVIEYPLTLFACKSYLV
ncbi:unnamed protein product [Candidula unifasciata]|uniref:Uncharacterized protein n=1 Tax=Candidula unifasciata TaxID=100452 RepID=A0A8S3YW69_9EUPU|nr:unnamed protein product [Candidula unifasciata]